MLRVVGEPRRIDRAIKRLQGALKGVPARGVRLTWRGGELRTTIHWARDDSFWWAFEPRRSGDGVAARHALLLGHAPDAPTRRESITCELNLPRTGVDRKVAGILAADDAGALYLAHSGRMGGARPGQRKAGFRDFLADGVWREVTWPDGARSAALIVAPLDSPRLTRLLGRFVDSVRRFKAGEAADRPSGLCIEPRPDDPATVACDRRLVDWALQEELTKRGLFGGAVDLFSLRGERPQPLFALVANGHAEELTRAVGSLSLASARRGADIKPILIAPAALADRDAAIRALPFACVRFRWRGARAVFDGLDDALEG
ncbi:MAG: hypothetical protein J0H77_35625 [Alphaproteobacteria bacterium]|jgi:hypothetical protein|nr:hypothetical protein [Alphaproteobacteria bacterium]